MTIKEKLETIKGKKIAIQCLNEWQARVIHKYLDNNNINCYWDNYGSHTCYDYQTRMMFADKEWFNGGANGGTYGALLMSSGFEHEYVYDLGLYE